MKATFHPDAEIDVAEAAEFYEGEGSPELAARFVAEIKRAVNLLLTFPGTTTAAIPMPPLLKVCDFFWRARARPQKASDPGAKRSHSQEGGYGEHLQRPAGDVRGDERACRN